MASARANIAAWTREADSGLDAIVVNTSGCGTTVKDYGYMLRGDAAYAARAAAVSRRAKSFSMCSRARERSPDPLRASARSNSMS